MNAPARGALWALVVLATVSLGAIEQEPPIIRAVRDGDLAAARSLVRAGADVNTPQADGTTALHWAARADRAELVSLLLGAGAKVDAANRYGVTPLLLAAANEGGAAVRLLVEAGADPNLANPDGQTPLMTAARTGSVAAVTALIDHGADVNRKEHWFGETALMWASAENNAEAVSALVAHGADINARADLVHLPNVKVDAATMVITALPRGGMTPLLLAAREGAAASARALIEAGADLNLPDPDGTSPLVMAIINAHYGVADLLVEHGADPAVADKSGMGAVYALVDMRTEPPMINRPPPKPTGAIDTLTLLGKLLTHGDPDLPLSSPILARQHNFGDAALGKGATALMRAAKSTDLPAMKLLLAHGASLTKTTGDGSNAAMFAARRGGGRNRGSLKETIDAVALCLDAGADINAADATGQTLLHMAVATGDELVQMLADRGANLVARDAAGRTPLDVALGAPAPPPPGRGGRAGRGGRGGAPGPGPVRESTAALLRRLMTARGLTVPEAPAASARP